MADWRRHVVIGFSLACASRALVGQVASEPVDRDVVARIRAEALTRSQVMATVEHLTDVIGPRLTNSPNLRRAQTYARDLLRGWGIGNAHLERWGPFGRGWSVEGFVANVTGPAFSPLIAYPKAWSAGTPGVVRGEPVMLDVKTAADLDRYRGKLKGRIVLFSPLRPLQIPPPSPRRMTGDDLARLAGAPFTAARAFQPSPDQRAASELAFRKWKLVYDEGAAVVLEPGFVSGGSVYVTSATLPISPDAPAADRPHPWDISRPVVVPQVVVAAEHYNRLVRLAAQGIATTLEINVGVRYDDADPMSDNVIGDIPGSDLKDEVVMIGGCLDSWHAGTGATDNAAGAGAALEAMRILQALGVHPRRSIRIGLWSAEEQGTLGSQAYVAQHFGRLVAPAGGSPRIERGPDYDRLAGYFNLDWGPGRIRGVYLQGNEAARPIFQAWLAPFADLGASTLSPSGIGATDHISFDRIGLPGFQFIRDFMEGAGGPGHTNLDLFDELQADDLTQTAAIVAAFAYDAAMRPQKLPRTAGR